MGKRILLVAQNFYPEFFKSNDIASEMVKRGHCVDVLTGIPNYPEGVFPNGYGVFKKRIDNYKGAKVYRAFQIPRGRKASGIRLAINYLSFAFTSTFWVLFFFLFKKKYDAIIIHQTSPVTQSLPGILLGKLKRIPIYTWVLDIWPDAMRSGGNVKNETIIGLIDSFTQWVYRNSHKILISSKDFRELINRKANYNNKITHFPNWCDDMKAMPLLEIPPLPKGFKIMMAGNLGTAQDIRTVMNAVILLKDNHSIQWIFVGDGSEKAYIEEYISNNNIANVTLTGRRPFNEMPAYFKEADAMLLTLRAEYPHLKAVVPARLQSYMSAGKAILGMVDGGSCTVIKECECGLCAEAGDYQSLAKNILTLSSNNEAKIMMGKNARRYYEEYFTTDICISNLERIICSNGTKETKHNV